MQNVGKRYSEISRRCKLIDPNFPTDVEIREVGPRDGLQNEMVLPVDQIVALIYALSATWLKTIEAASFVHPKAIPPMAGSAEVMAKINRV